MLVASPSPTARLELIKGDGILNLVDLASSERLSQSKSEGARLRDTQNINRSLSNLGNVVFALSQKVNQYTIGTAKIVQ